MKFLPLILKNAFRKKTRTLLTIGSIVLPLYPSFLFVATTQALTGVAAAVFAPALAAITLGIVGPKAFARRIGRNELSVIEVCRAYVTAQRDYAAADPLRTGHHEFAQRFASTAGMRDGLYWPTKPGEEESPLGPLVARARAEGGSGLGLTIARAIAGAHGGTLTAQSDGVGTGATLTLRIPRVAGPLP